MYAAIASKSEGYCTMTFHATHAEFCIMNDMEKTLLPDPTPKMLDLLATGNCSVTQVITPPRESPIPPSVIGAVVESISSQAQTQILTQVWSQAQTPSLFLK